MHPGSRGRNCAKGPATLNQMHGSRAHPLSAAARRARAARASGSASPGTRRSTTSAGASARRSSRGGRRRSCTTSAGPGHELVYLQRVFHAWGIDGHNSHTNVCSASARAGYAFWHGLDRPSPGPRQRALHPAALLAPRDRPLLQPARPADHRGQDGAAPRSCVIDTRLSNTASMADYWLSPWPGTEAAMLLAMAHVLAARAARWDREFVRRWVNWEEYLREERPDAAGRPSSAFERALDELYASLHPGVRRARERRARRAHRGGRARDRPRRVGARHPRLAQRRRRQPRRLAGRARAGAPRGAHGRRRHARAAPRPARWNKAVPAPPMMPPPGKVWSELLMPREYPLAFFEMSFLLPHFLKEGRGKLAMYFTRVYNPVWTNPDGMSWIEMLTDEAKVERHACLTPTWSETAWFADYVLPMGHASERHDLMSQETHAARWIGFRQPVLRVALERQGKRFDSRGRRTRRPGSGRCGRRTSSGSSCRGGSIPTARSASASTSSRPTVPARSCASRSSTAGSSSTACPACPRPPRTRGADAARVHAQVRRVPRRGRASTAPTSRRRSRRRSARAPRSTPSPRLVTKDGAGGRRRDRRPAPRRLPHALAQARVLLQDAQGLEVAGARGADLHRGATCTGPNIDRAKGEMVLLPTFRLPTLDPHALRQRQVALRDLAHATRSGCIRRTRRGSASTTGDLLQVATEIGHFVDKVWVTEGDPARRRRLLASPRALAARTRDAAASAGPPRSWISSSSTPGEWRMRHDPRRAAVRERRPGLAARLVGGRGRPPEPDVPGAARPGERPALLAPEGDA